MVIPMNAASHIHLIKCFIQAQHEYPICRSFSVFELYSTHCSDHGYFCPSWNSLLIFFQAPWFTFIQYCCPYVTLINNPFHPRGSLLQYSISLHSLKLTHPHLVLAVTAASHHPPALTLSPRYVNSLTVSTSSHNFSSCSTASPIFPSHFLHARFLDHVGVTIFTPAHLPWIYLPHCRHKTELAFTLMLPTP